MTFNPSFDKKRACKAHFRSRSEANATKTPGSSPRDLYSDVSHQPGFFASNMHASYRPPSSISEEPPSDTASQDERQYRAQHPASHETFWPHDGYADEQAGGALLELDPEADVDLSAVQQLDGMVRLAQPWGHTTDVQVPQRSGRSEHIRAGHGSLRVSRSPSRFCSTDPNPPSELRSTTSWGSQPPANGSHGGPSSFGGSSRGPRHDRNSFSRGPSNEHGPPPGPAADAAPPPRRYGHGHGHDHGQGSFALHRDVYAEMEPFSGFPDGIGDANARREDERLRALQRIHKSFAPSRKRSRK